MRRMLRLFIVLTVFLNPITCFSWGEGKHAISELVIHHVYLDSNYVFCGSDAFWGTNIFGLFVFDRSTESWTNYPGLLNNPSYYGQVKAIEAVGDSVYVTFHNVGMLGFNRQNGLCDTIAVIQNDQVFHRAYQLTANGSDYRICRDSVIEKYGAETKIYTPPSELIFSHPVVYENQIYMPYTFDEHVPWTYTKGIAVFDIDQKKFSFYESDIFVGMASGGFVHDSLLIFPTAKYIYESNVMPASGFVAFSPADFTFSLWEKLPLPKEPPAILDVAQDDKEYWIGTDNGIFRIDKKTNKAKHYQIVKGIVNKDGTNVYYLCGGPAENSSYVALELNKGQKVEILGVLNGWCEIMAPQGITGTVDARYVAQEVLREDIQKLVAEFKPLKKGETIPIMIPGNVPFELDSLSLKEHVYEIVGKNTKQGEITSYGISLPTAWISMKLLYFQLGEVE